MEVFPMAEEMTEHAARECMLLLVSEYTDARTGQVNRTELAEACAAEFDANHMGGPLDDETHWLWVLADDVATADEASRGVTL